MEDRPSTPSYALPGWLWIALGIFSLQTAPTTAFVKSLPLELATESSRRWQEGAPTAFLARGDRPPTQGYRALTQWLWIARGVFSFHSTTAFAKSLPTESSRRWLATAHKATPAMAVRPPV